MKPQETRNIEELVAAVATAERAKYVYFWGHQPRVPGAIDSSCLSQWYAASFSAGEEHYPTAEHYMMAKKAELFSDSEAKHRVLSASSPGEAKAVGREVRGFDPNAWESRRFEIVVTGNLRKFSANPLLRDYLDGTGERVLVEASPVDRIWGIGLDVEAARASEPRDWSGLNLLGFALMEVRQRLRESGATG